MHKLRNVLSGLRQSSILLVAVLLLLTVPQLAVADTNSVDVACLGTTTDNCLKCHAEQQQIFQHAMSTRAAEKQFCQRSWGAQDGDFFATNCVGCHVSSCLDCHATVDGYNTGDEGDERAGVGADRGGVVGDRVGNKIQRPDNEVCYRCHNGYFVGWDFAGRAPREDSVRYQRGPQANGQHYLKMRPDIHAEAGMQCADCHSMASLARGEKSSKTCRDCHTVDKGIIEHSIPAHLQKMECASCHAAWAAQDYGTYYIRTENSDNRQFFRVRKVNDKYIKSSYLKRQDLPPLGLNARGLVAPIRPQFIAYYSAMVDNKAVGVENNLLLAQWKAFTPHTIRRGTVMCNGCHGNSKRFMLQPLEQRKYRPDLDGLTLQSFWRAEGQEVVNGSFYPADSFARMSQKSLQYSRKYVEKWQSFLKKDAASSEH